MFKRRKRKQQLPLCPRCGEEDETLLGWHPEENMLCSDCLTEELGLQDELDDLAYLIEAPEMVLSHKCIRVNSAEYTNRQVTGL